MRIEKRKIAVLLLICVVGLLRAAAAEDIRYQNLMIERSFTSEKTYADPFNDIEVDVVFTAPDGKESRVPAFWDGGQTWKVRYSSPQIGTHHFRTECSDKQNATLHGINGTIEVAAYSGMNALYQHGQLRVAEDKKHFEHADGTPFLWLADTWWMGLCKRLHWPEEFRDLTMDRIEKGFNVVQIVAGLYPDMPAFDERGANEAGFPWEKDYSRINPKYFDEADKRIQWLVESNIAPCIVGAWGYHIPWMGEETFKKHWRYLVARWGAYPVFWCIAGEGAMPYYLTPKDKRDEEIALQKKVITETARYVRQIDPWRHPITVHPTDSSRTQVTDVSVLDFDMLQTGHGDRDSIGPTIEAVRKSRAAQPPMPTIVAEVCYEGILGKSHEDIQRFMVWTCLLSGCAGHTYGANGIWQLNRKDQPYGKSPHGGDWGQTPWDEAANLPGSTQVGLAKKFLEKYEWWKFEPHQEWATDMSNMARPNPYMIPYAAGIPGKVRIIYLPLPRWLVLHQLEAGLQYDAKILGCKGMESKGKGMVGEIISTVIEGDDRGNNRIESGIQQILSPLEQGILNPVWDPYKDRVCVLTLKKP